MQLEDLELKKLGEDFLAPIILQYFQKVAESVEMNKKTLIIFVAREGFFLEKLWASCGLSKNITTEYFYASRVLLNRALNIHSSLKWNRITKQFYQGTILNFLKERLGIQSKFLRNIDTLPFKNLNQLINLPKDEAVIFAIFKIILDDPILSKLLNKTKVNFTNYVNLKFQDFEDIIYCDLGWSGSVPAALSEISNCNLRVVYFQFLFNQLADYGNIHLANSLLSSRSHQNSEFNYNEGRGSLGQFFEKLFRAPENLVIDFDSNLIPIFHQNQDFLDEDIEKLFKIHEGTKVGIDNLIFSGMKIDEICEKSIEFFMLKGTSNFIDQHFNRVKDDYTGVIW
jgi:hypothetical protein